MRLAVRELGKGQSLAVECEAKLLGPAGLSSGHRSVSTDQVDPALWRGPALLAAGVLIFWYAPALSHSLLCRMDHGAVSAGARL